MSNPANTVINVNGIEVIYNHVILVLKGVSLSVAEGQIVPPSWAATVPARRRRCAPSPTCCRASGGGRKGTIELRGEASMAEPGRAGQARRGAGDGRPPLLRPPDD